MRLDFVRGPANAETFDNLLHWARRTPEVRSGTPISVGHQVMVLWGSPGVGKSRMLEEILSRCSGARLDAEHIESASEDGKLYGLDDVHELSTLSVFSAVNTAIAGRMRLLLVGEGRPATWTEDGVPGAADLKSRLSAVSGVMLDAPDESMIVRALGDALYQVGLAVPDTTVEWAAGRLRRDFQTVIACAHAAARKTGEVRGHKALFEAVMNDNPQLCLS